ncbi:myb/SANT-like DNA-binding domain-containing protein 4 [Haliotis rubra]|uniref:myb/SANT-like DNA-binding domain-containing protein 4 n=1 Tax=Haliotis rubra TaxID=36100 RepID=UPI001EE610DE|nr:myb/SANT-like DNA-binding domain-containing protein 4 [Haliotis rubra]
MLSSAIFTMATEGVPELKKRGKGWSEAEEVCLIQEVLQREKTLFGDMKGCGVKSIHRQRTDGWQEITDTLNARHINAKRETLEVKKKYFNLKQRAKAKIDGLKRSMAVTGGGPPPPALTSADEVLSQSLEGRPGIHGLDHGIDTDDAYACADETDTAAEGPVGEEPQGERAVPQQENDSDVIKKSRKQRRNQAEATYHNTIEDTKRIKLEQKKLQMEIEMLAKNQKKLDSEIQLLHVRSIYYQLKMNAEFGVSLENWKTEE